MLSASRDLSLQRLGLSSWLELLWNSGQAASREELVSLCGVISCFNKFLTWADVTERLRWLTRNQLGSPRAGSSPAVCESVPCGFFSPILFSNFLTILTTTAVATVWRTVRHVQVWWSPNKGLRFSTGCWKVMGNLWSLCQWTSNEFCFSNSLWFHDASYSKCPGWSWYCLKVQNIYLLQLVRTIAIEKSIFQFAIISLSNHQIKTEEKGAHCLDDH